MIRSLFVVFIFLFSSPVWSQDTVETITVGGKAFTESHILAEIMAQLLEAEGYKVERKFGLGGTLICYEALRTGEIGVYADYTGTISKVILKTTAPMSRDEIARQLRKRGIGLLPEFGFDNSYALVVRETTASELDLQRISDLAHHATLRMAFSHEFRNRADGWPGLIETYEIDRVTSGIEHALAYRALAEEKIDVTDAYTTDGDLDRYRLVVLEDDAGFFSEYHAVPLVHNSVHERIKPTLAKLAGRIDDVQMRALNAKVVVSGLAVDQVASAFLSDEGLVGRSDGDLRKAGSASGMWPTLWRNTRTHLKLTAIALFGACIVGLAIALTVYRSKRMSQVALYVTGLMQTIPSIALLALMIPLLGIGQKPAIAALFLYSLLPILRNGITAMLTIDPLYRKVAEAMGLTRGEQLRHVLIPLALPHVLAGVRTAAVISIGTATLAAFIGAGGLGEPIWTGLQLNDTGLILQGAIPAALLALLTELGFELLERRLIPAHMVSNRLQN